MEDILLFNVLNKTVENILSQFGISVVNPQVKILDSSSTNIIYSIDDKYVVKCKNIQSHKSTIFLFEKLLKEVNHICNNIYLTTVDGSIFVCEGQRMWFVMKYVRGDKFDFGNDKQIESVAEHIKTISMHGFCGFDEIKKELKEIQAPKNDINLIFNYPNSFFDNYCKDIKDIISSENYRDEVLKEVYHLIDEVINGAGDYSQLNYGFSHGEIQGQNLIFNGNNVKCAIDWDSVGIRPIVFDVAMGGCFICRKARGQFIIDERKLNCYIRKFSEMSCVEKSNIFNSMLIGFIPDRGTMLSYAIDDQDKAIWYLKWSLDALRELRHQETVIKNIIEIASEK